MQKNRGGKSTAEEWGESAIGDAQLSAHSVEQFALSELIGFEQGSANSFGSGFSEVICIPAPQLSSAERELWRRVRFRTLLGLPPESRAEMLIRETRRALQMAGYGKRVTIPALFAGINLALAKSMGVKMSTPLRGIARDLGIRYSTLLLVRRIALVQVARLGPMLEMGVELDG